jgi:tetrahydromethanopterin S-methyltransferase subunit G
MDFNARFDEMDAKLSSLEFEILSEIDRQVGKQTRILVTTIIATVGFLIATIGAIAATTV